MKLAHRILTIIGTLATCITGIEAGPSSLFWTNCTTSILTTGTAQFIEYNFFTVFNRRGHGQYLNPDTGFTLGIFNWQHLHAEAGVDYFGGADDPWFFNAKIGMNEDRIFKHCPAFNVGIFDIGTRTRGNDRTNANIVDFIFGKTLPECFGGGNLYAGAFSGSRAMGKNRQGWMVGYTRSFVSEHYCDGRDYNKWAITLDYASGKNTIGGGSASIAYYFTPDIYLESGPVWFNTAKYNGTWKWGMEIYIDFTVFDKSNMSF